MSTPLPLAIACVMTAVPPGRRLWPALRAADVGLGIGRESTNAARDIAQAFIATDELEGLINAIEQGRTTYANIRKAIRYLLETNLSEVLLMLGGALAGTGAALTPMQLLWINLITDVLPGIALALEPPEPGVMERAPPQSQGSIFGSRDLKKLAGEGALLAAGPMLAGLYGAARFGAGSPQSRTMARSAASSPLNCCTRSVAVRRIRAYSGPANCRTIPISAGRFLPQEWLRRAQC